MKNKLKNIELFIRAFIPIAIVLMLILPSCASNKSAKIKSDTDKHLQEGFVGATIGKNYSGFGCPFFIVLDDGTRLIYVNNISKKYEKTDPRRGKRVWIKYKEVDEAYDLRCNTRGSKKVEITAIERNISPPKRVIKFT